MKTVLSPMSIWRHDLSSCLQDAVATVLLHHGHDPVPALGAAWEFYYPAGDFRREEYYYPCRWPEDPARSLAPFHPVTSRWHTPANVESGWQEVKESVRRGTPAIVAVDNYYLPFRPAYQDVHTNHLIIVYGFDEEAGEVYVLDNKPPQYQAAIQLSELHAARDSGNPGDDRSLYFYTNNPIQNRWLEVQVTGSFPELTRDWVSHVVRTNLSRFRQDSDERTLLGMDGLDRYLASIRDRAAGPDGPVAMDELYVVGWAVQQATGLHADFLTAAGRKLGWHRLAEIGREVDRLAHHWSDLRMLGAHWRDQAAEVTTRIARRAARLLSDQEQVLHEMEALLRNG